MIGGSDAGVLDELTVAPTCTCLPGFAYEDAFLLEGVLHGVSGIGSGFSELDAVPMPRGSEPARVRRPSIRLLLLEREIQVSIWSQL